MRWLLYLIVLGAALIVPLEKNNVGQLQPMEVLYVCRIGDMVILKTDTDDLGLGKTVAEAVRDLHETTPGIVYLDTADFLIVNENAKQNIGELELYLKPSVGVCITEADIDLASTAQYLSAHKPKVKLKDRNEHQKAQIITVENGRINLKENS